MGSRWVIQGAAERHATKHYVDEALCGAFVAGAKWVVEQLIRRTEVHPMEDQAGARQYCDKLRLKDVNQFIREVAKYERTECRNEEL